MNAACIQTTLSIDWFKKALTFTLSLNMLSGLKHVKVKGKINGLSEGHTIVNIFLNTSINKNY